MVLLILLLVIAKGLLQPRRQLVPHVLYLGQSTQKTYQFLLLSTTTITTWARLIKLTNCGQQIQGSDESGEEDGRHYGTSYLMLHWSIPSCCRNIRIHTNSGLTYNMGF